MDTGYAQERIINVVGFFINPFSSDFECKKSFHAIKLNLTFIVSSFASLFISTKRPFLFSFNERLTEFWSMDH
jgi:hypothetical protein